MNWNNINDDKCPSCGGNLHFKLRGSSIRIGERKGGKLKEDYYFCFGCDFCISSKKLIHLKKKQHDTYVRSFKNIPKEFKEGYLAL